MGARRLAAAWVATVMVVASPIAGCGTAPEPEPPVPVAVTDLPVLPRLATAPARSYPVGVRSVTVHRGDRLLPTTVWYPAASGLVGSVARRKISAAHGRFPLVLFSHGLSGLPQRYAGLAQAWAAAGFVVAAPLYPHTSGWTRQFVRNDIDNQPADAMAVIQRLRQLDTVRGDLLRGRVDATRVAAIGHSAGGFTTNGMFASGHDPRLVAGVVIAGWLGSNDFGGPPASLLFVHGARDTIVPVAASRIAYERVPMNWPKSFRMLKGNWHSEYLRPGERGFTGLRAITTNFLRWNLYGDDSAHRRLPPSDVPEGTVPPEARSAALSPIGP
jgi:dienelactone hydrolase